MKQPWAKCDVGHQGLIAEAGEFGLLMNRARVYSPKLSRFVQRDPLGYVDGISLVQYVGSGPVGRVDPWGELQVQTLLVETTRNGYFHQAFLRSHSISNSGIDLYGQWKLQSTMWNYFSYSAGAGLRVDATPAAFWNASGILNFLTQPRTYTNAVADAVPSPVQTPIIGFKKRGQSLTDWMGEWLSGNQNLGANPADGYCIEVFGAKQDFDLQPYVAQGGNIGLQAWSQIGPFTLGAGGGSIGAGVSLGTGFVEVGVGVVVPTSSNSLPAFSAADFTLYSVISADGQKYSRAEGIPAAEHVSQQRESLQSVTYKTRTSMWTNVLARTKSSIGGGIVRVHHAGSPTTWQIEGQ